MAPTGWFSAPEMIPTLGPLNDTAPLPPNWMLWAMLPPPPPPSSSPPAGGSQPCSEVQPLVETPVTEAPPGFDTQILLGSQSLFDTQSRLDSQPQVNGQPSWNFQASTSWPWRQSPGSFPWHQKSHDTPGRLLLLSVPRPHLLIFSPSLSSFSFSLSTEDFALLSWNMVINVS